MNHGHNRESQTAIWERSGIPVFRRGVNFGNFLESRFEGEHTAGLLIQDEWFGLLKDAGFDCVRLPVRWSAHAAASAPYAVERAFIDRVAHVVDQALARGFVVIVNQHHYIELMQTPAAHRERFIALWKIIAGRFQGYPEKLFFELLNEPTHSLTSPLWNQYWPEAYHTVRAVDRSRIIICGPHDWNNVTGLDRLSLTAFREDSQLMGPFHYYEPHIFTHQGASWVDPPHPLGASWTGTSEETTAIARDFDMALAWANRENRPLFLGEFGAYPKINPEDQVVKWTACVREEAEKRGIPWCYWEFCHGFGVWDRKRQAFKTGLLKALLG